MPKRKVARGRRGGAAKKGTARTADEAGCIEMVEPLSEANASNLELSACESTESLLETKESGQSSYSGVEDKKTELLIDGSDKVSTEAKEEESNVVVKECHTADITETSSEIEPVSGTSSTQEKSASLELPLSGDGGEKSNTCGIDDNDQSEVLLEEKGTEEDEDVQLLEEKGTEEEEEDVQYIDEEADEDQQLFDVMGTTNDNTAKKDDAQSEASTFENEVKQFLTARCSSSKSKLLDNENCTFEEISEGSIGQPEQEEISSETAGDVDVTGMSFQAKSSKDSLPEAESLEEVFFATENDDTKIIAEDKDNDDISDTSLSDHGGTNLSLEEISDDDLEPSKKRRKSAGLTFDKVAAVKNLDAKKPPHDTESKVVPEIVSEDDRKPSETKVNKRPASFDKDSIEDNVNKKVRLSEGMNDSDRKPELENMEKLLDHIKTEKEVKKEKSPLNDSKLDNKGSAAISGATVSSETLKNRSTSQTERGQSQNSRHERQTSKERHYPSRDLPYSSREFIEKRRRYELINTSTQTEPRQLKGKIVQCNINPISVAPLYKELQNAVDMTASSSKLFEKMKDLLPSSIPEKIFKDITSSVPTESEKSYTFSMGPVTLSDMDSTEFREVALKGADKFSLNFDMHCHGIFKAALSKHEDIASLTRHLKRLELGNRYMCMSFTYCHGTDSGPMLWKATVVFMYEQDIQLESQGLVSDGKVRAKIILNGVPKGVSKDFIHLLFPEALSVSTAPGKDEDRVVVLGFSSTKMVEEILSCYDLVVINGSQVKISCMDSVVEPSGDLPSDVPEEAGVMIIADKDDSNNLPHDNVTEVSEDQQVPDSQVPTDTGLEPSSGDAGAIECIDISKTGPDSVDISKTGPDSVETTGNKEQKLTDSNKDVTGAVIDVTDEQSSALADVCANVKDATDVLDQSDTVEKCDVDNTEVSKSQDKSLDSSVIELNSDGENITAEESTSKQSTADPSTVGVEPEAAQVEKKCTEKAQGVDKVKHSVKETDNEHLEDVSDDEMINQSKELDIDDVVILREDKVKRVIANIDLTNEESNSSEVQVPESKDAAAPQEVKKVEEKLIMTDGSLEVTMEAIDVTEDDDGCGQVLYSRTTRASSKEMDRILKERDNVYSKSWASDRWPSSSYKSKYDPYYSSRQSYSKPSKEYASRSSPPYQPSSSKEALWHTKTSSREDLRGRVPAREETTSRREPLRYEKSRTPSPRRYSSWYKEADTYKSSKPHYTSEYYGSSERKYSSSSHWGGYNDKWSSYYGESKTYPRPVVETEARSRDWHPKSSTYHHSSWKGDRHGEPEGHHYDSRSHCYPERKYSPKRSRSNSYSDMSISSGCRSPHRQKVYERSPKRPFKHTSRSPISISSRSHSLSPVSKSPSPCQNILKMPAKSELVKSVKQFLVLAKDLHAQAKRKSRSRSIELHSPRRSRSPGYQRIRSPPDSPPRHLSGRSQMISHSPQRARSRSPPHYWRRDSRSPNYKRAAHSRYERSASPVSVEYPRSKKYKDHVESKQASYKEFDRHDSRSQKARNYTQSSDEQHKSGQWQFQSYSNEPQWQQSYGGYQAQTKPASGPEPPSTNTFNPPYPPPNFQPTGYSLPQQDSSMYHGSSMSVYQYNTPAQYGYNSMPPNVPNPYLQNPAPPIPHAYQQALTALQSAMTSQPPPQVFEPSNTSSSNASSKNKKSWSMGSNAMVFQRILGSDGGKKKSGTIEKIGDRERLERPKQSKEVRVLTNVLVKK